MMEDDGSRGEEHQAKEVLFGISTFLNFFQLTYHISERAMVTLLLFLRTLLLYLSTFSQGNSILKTLAQLIPKSLYSIRKIIRKSDTIKDRSANFLNRLECLEEIRET